MARQAVRDLRSLTYSQGLDRVEAALPATNAGALARMKSSKAFSSIGEISATGRPRSVITVGSPVSRTSRTTALRDRPRSRSPIEGIVYLSSVQHSVQMYIPHYA